MTSLSLSNGVLRLVSAKRGVDTLIDNVQGRFDGLKIGDQLRFSLSAVWRNTPVRIAGALNDPESAAKGAPTSILFALNSPLAKLGFSGALALGDARSAEGDLTASVPSIAALTAFLNIGRPPVLAADDIAITAKVKAGAHGWTLDDATLTSAGQKVQGALAIDEAGGHPTVSGTLAAETLEMGPLLGPPRSLFDPSGGWSAKPFAVAALQTFDLDLRLSAAHLDVYGLTLADAAASVIVNDGGLNITLINSAAYGGRLQGEAAVASVGRDVEMSARGELVGADLGAAIADFGQPLMTGSGRAQFAVEASGASPAAAIASLTGTASLEAADGAILGVNLEEALRRSRRRPIDVGRDMRPRRNGVRQARRFFIARPRPRPGRTRRDDQPRRDRRNGRSHRSCRPELGSHSQRGADRRGGRGVARRRAPHARHRGPVVRADDPRDWRERRNAAFRRSADLSLNAAEALYCAASL